MSSSIPEAKPSSEIVGFQISAVNLALLPIVAVMAWGVWNVYSMNSRFIDTTPRFNGADLTLDWMKRYDSSVYYLNLPMPTGWHQPILSRGFYWMNAWYGWSLLETPSNTWDVTIPYLKLNGKYLIVGKGTVPFEKDATLIESLNGFDIFRLPSSPPFAFVYHPTGGEILQPSQMKEVAVQWTSPNDFQMQVSAETGDYVVAMVPFYPGWSVTVNGQTRQILNVSSFLGVVAEPGEPVYKFSFSPLSFKVGLTLFIITMMALVVYSLWRRPTQQA